MSTGNHDNFSSSHGVGCEAWGRIWWKDCVYFLVKWGMNRWFGVAKPRETVIDFVHTFE
jgi:hypothetical protein